MVVMELVTQTAKTVVSYGTICPMEDMLTNQVVFQAALVEVVHAQLMLLIVPQLLPPCKLAVP